MDTESKSGADAKIELFLKLLNHTEKVCYANRLSTFVEEIFNYKRLDQDTEAFQGFAKNTLIVVTNKKELNYLYNQEPFTKKKYDKPNQLIFHEAILYLLSKGQQNYYIQAKGYSLHPTQKGKINLDVPNSFNRVLQGRHLRTLQGIVGDYHLGNIYKYYSLFNFNGEYFIQYCGSKITGML